MNWEKVIKIWLLVLVFDLFIVLNIKSFQLQYPNGYNFEIKKMQFIDPEYYNINPIDCIMIPGSRFKYARKYLSKFNQEYHLD